MIERYTRKEMADIWTEDRKLQTWLEIEIAICEAYAEIGIIPREDLKVIRERAQADVRRVQEIEKATKHDVVAFIQAVSESVGPASKWVHLGVTSSDVLDTTFSVLLQQASAILVKDVENLMAVLKEKAFAYKFTPMIGRTHGIHAEPITFGLKIAHFYDEMRRNLERLTTAKDHIAYGKISGAVGTYAHVPPFVEEYVCKKLGLKPAPISTQIVPRDYYAEFFTVLAIIGSSVEKLATEIRHLQRTEVGEAEEYFQEGQTGSSAMPHKRNPIGSENLSGLARLLRGYALSALENVPLWHERDISHSSVERVIGPDATILLDYMLQRLTNLYRNLMVYPERMRKNMEITGGLYHSEAILLSLIKKGLTRQEAYKITQSIAMACYQGHLNFIDCLKNDEGLRKHLTEQELDQVTDDEHYFEQVETIFNRVFG
ncbi:MAG: Adenylosuccinate lyase [Syntrophorhabdaceae bacterium PtaU1.Bin034]|nr:MAG: Adenylosuccinate lyase [Syntrophorhabdaceae bacterium PtaU1.Bin034]